MAELNEGRKGILSLATWNLLVTEDRLKVIENESFSLRILNCTLILLCSITKSCENNNEDIGGKIINPCGKDQERYSNGTV